jgi:hypothetical protein
MTKEWKMDERAHLPCLVIWSLDKYYAKKMDEKENVT